MKQGRLRYRSHGSASDLPGATGQDKAGQLFSGISDGTMGSKHDLGVVQTEQQSGPRGQSPTTGLLSQPRAPAASPGLTVHKVTPTAAEHRRSSARSHLPGLRTRALSPPDSSLDGHTGWSVRIQGINQLLEGFMDPLGNQGPPGRSTEQTSRGHS